ncbi:MAG: hydroxymethylpyrimidine/phosphomethylpyrimidine kinase, partial [Gammaproteobacteria bacterium]|nr:hydroxymethylpyrimidine/phosphomethylpyrimidine kinase [Gammaproteobacteria bacterium]
MRRTVLVIGGTDSSGGAGLVRDVQVLTELEVRVRCVVTAVTVQTDQQVGAIQYISADVVRQQMLAALEDGGIDAIKIGMLGARATIQTIVETLPSPDEIPIVLDPVIASSSGGALLEESGLSVLRDHLISRVTIITPNLLESAILLDDDPATDELMMISQAQRLLRLGPRAVLLKGGHGTGAEAVDVLSSAASHASVQFRGPRVDAILRGTGCTLSSAMAS